MRNLYPYSIPDQTSFHRESIPVFGSVERIEFFYKYKRTTENLYIGEIDKHHLMLIDSDSLLNSIRKYFDNRLYLSESLANYSANKLFPKICWLVNSFLTKGLTHPIAVHYNPRIQRNVIHPGSVRAQVIKLFQNTPNVNCLYFNTGGVEFEFLKSMKIFDKNELLNATDNMEIELVADHGSIIPHINLDASSVRPTVLSWQYFIYRRLLSSSFSVFSTIDVLQPWYADENNSNIQIYIKNESLITDWPSLLCKAIILSIVGKSYESDTLTVVHKNSFETPG